MHLRRIAALGTVFTQDTANQLREVILSLYSALVRLLNPLQSFPLHNRYGKTAAKENEDDAWSIGIREEAEKRLFSLEKRGSRGNLSICINT